MLTDTTCKNAKAKDKPYKLADEKGMFLLVNPNGSKYFRLKYRIDGKEKLLALGIYPEISLKQARDKRDEARSQLADSIDPNENRKAIKLARADSAANSFEVLAREWFERNMTDKSDSHKKRIISGLKRDIFPYIGSKPVLDIKAVELLAVLRKIEERAIETAHRMLWTCGAVFRYAITTGRLDADITQALRGSLKPVNGGHFSAITNPKELGALLLRAIDSYSGSLLVKKALKIAPRIFVRPIELRGMEWSQIDFETKEWRYLVTKTNVQHIVPLANQVINAIQELQLITGHGRFVFPSDVPRMDRAVCPTRGVTCGITTYGV